MKKIISSVCALSIAMLISFNCFAVPASAVSPVAVADAPSIFFTALKSLGYTFSYSPAVSSAASTTASASGYNSYLFNKIIEGAIANGFITGASSASAVGTTIAGGASVTLGGVVLTAGAAAAIVAAAFYIDSQMAEPSTDIFKMPDGSVVNFRYNGTQFDLFANSTSRVYHSSSDGYVLSAPGSIIPLVTKTYPAGFQFNYDDYWEPFYACGAYFRISPMRMYYPSNVTAYKFFIESSLNGTTWTGGRAYFYFTRNDTPEQYIKNNVRISSDGQGHLTLLDDFNIYLSATIYDGNYVLSFSTDDYFDSVAASRNEYSPLPLTGSLKRLVFPFLNSLIVTSSVIPENSDIIENFTSTSSASSRLEALDTAVENASADTDVVATIPNITAESMETLPLDLVQNTADIDTMVIDGYTEAATGADFVPVDDTWSDVVENPAAGYEETPADYPASDPSATDMLQGDTFAGPWHYVVEVLNYCAEFFSVFLIFLNNGLPYSMRALLWAIVVLVLLFGLLFRLLK